jgi:pimeloyl-ACP methyl ester carboxylesterase
MSRLEIDGGALHYEARGAGPALLVIAGGDGDADTCDGIASRLARDFTVVTYDRRGISRSTGGARPIDVRVHADDAARLLGALSPAYVFGTSLGALIGLDLVIRHPTLVRALVAHEPPLPQVLPPPDRAAAIAAQERIERVFRHEGLDAAMRAVVESTGIDVRGREPDAVLPRPSARRRHTLTRMLTHDTPAARHFRVDLHALRMSAVPVDVGAGTAAGFPQRCAVALAVALERPVVDFPGGHTGYVTHPTAFAARLREVLPG